jgi:hypothetical protein
MSSYSSTKEVIPSSAHEFIDCLALAALRKPVQKA